MKTSTSFPKSAGWITAKLSLKRGATFTEDDARNFITLGKPHRAQFGLIDVSRNPVRVIFRENRRAAVQPDAQRIEVDFDIHAPVPFIAKCGQLIVEVKQVREEFLPMHLIRVEILAGKHFNDAGDYGPGDEVTIGPLTEHWRILQFPDPQSA